MTNSAKPLLRSLLLLVALLAAACFQRVEIRPDIQPERPTVPPHALTGGVQVDPLPERAREDPNDPFSEHPLFYYGRVKILDQRTTRLLTFLGFKHDTVGFMDDFRAATPGKVHTAGGWQYAIATATQWNILLRFPLLTGGVEINPRTPGKAYPMLDSMTAGRVGESLDPKRLATYGFQPAFPKVYQNRGTTRECAMPSVGDGPGYGAQWFGEDWWEAAKDGASGLGELIHYAASGSSSAFAELLGLAVAGVKEAVDYIRSLANDGVCAIAGSETYDGRIYVRDLITNGYVIDPRRLISGSRELSDAEPMRYISVKGRDKTFGFLVEDDDADETGYFKLSFCNGISYNIAAELDGPYVSVVDTTVHDPVTGTGVETVVYAAPIWVDLVAAAGIGSGAGGANYAAYFVDTDDAGAAAWYMGAQIGYWDLSTRFDFRPRKATISYYGFAGKAVMAFAKLIDKERALAACGELGALTTMIAGVALTIPGGQPVAAGLAAAAASGDAHADIFGHRTENASRWPTSVGVPIHEYGHYAVCEMISQRSYYNKTAYLWDFVKLIASTKGSEAEQLKDPVRNSGEALADFFAFSAYGYTDYFNQPTPRLAPKWCVPTVPGAATPYDCLDPDGDYPYLPADSKENAKGQLASRASVMYDWYATGLPTTGGLHLQAAPENLGKAIGLSAPNVETQNFGRLIGESEAQVCATFLSHNWPDCPAFSLDPPSNFSGVAVSQSQIQWSWLPNAALATTYVVQQDVANVWADASPAFEPTVASWTQGSLKSNQRVTARVQSRLSTASASSIVAQVCTLAESVPTLLVFAPPVGSAPMRVTWLHKRASRYRVVRIEGTTETLAGVVVPTPGQTSAEFLDEGVIPGSSVRYRIDAENCDGVVTKGVASPSTAVPVSELDNIFVNAGATGTGTLTSPVGSITDALALVTTERRRILVRSGTYPEWIDVPGGPSVSIIGSYSNAAFTQRTALHTTIIERGNSDRIFGNPANEEFFYRTMPMVSAQTALRIDGLYLRAGFAPVSLFQGHGQDPITFSNSSLEGPVGAQFPPAPLQLNPRALVDCTGCDVEFSHVFATGSADTAFIGGSGDSFARPASITIRDSYVMTLTDNVNGDTSLSSPTFRLDRSIIRNGGPPNWTTDDPFVWSDEATVTASVVAGRLRAQYTLLGAQSVFIGPVTAGEATLVNNVLLPEKLVQTQPFLTIGQSPCGPFVCQGGPLGVPQIRNNFFATTGASVPLVATAWRTQFAAGPLPVASLNDGTAWSGFAGLVGGNQFNTQPVNELFFSFGPSPAFQFRFQPRAGSPLLRAGNQSAAVGSLLPGTDMLGQPFLFVDPPNVGAFAGAGL